VAVFTDSLGFPTQIIMLPTNGKNFDPFFHTFRFSVFYFLRSSSTEIIKWRPKNRYPGLVTDLMETQIFYDLVHS
jgi:hypothetical protein